MRGFHERGREREAYRPENWSYAETGRLATLSGGAEVRPGVTAFPWPGHRGQAGGANPPGGKTAFSFATCSDRARASPWIREDDRCPVERIAEKAPADDAAAEGWLCVSRTTGRAVGHDVDELNGRRACTRCARIAPVLRPPANRAYPRARRAGIRLSGEAGDRARILPFAAHRSG
jgi:hypothetical protein